MDSKITYISHSSATSFKECPQKYKYQHVMRIEPLDKGASLAFGSAFDVALSTVLLAKKDNRPLPTAEQTHNIFLNDSTKGWGLVKNNLSLKFTQYDFDSRVFKQEDWDYVSHLERELHTTVEDTKAAYKKRAYSGMSNSEEKLWQQLCWISLKNKALAMINVFYTDVLPNIRKVYLVQHKIEGSIDESTQIVGYVDLVCEYGDKAYPVIFDIKTAALDYDFDSIRLSEQLRLYTSYLGKTFNTHLAGFMVFLKHMGSEEYCSICGYRKNTNHKTCNAEIAGTRCGGEWRTVPKARVQILIDEITDEQQVEFLESFANLASVITSGLTYKNLNMCKHPRYGLCGFYQLCHKKDMTKYKWPNEEIKQKFLKGE